MRKARSKKKSPSPAAEKKGKGKDCRYHLAELRAGIKPFRLYWSARLRSTNNYAGKMRKTGRLFAPAIVLCGNQIAGRGRGNNSWWSDRGTMTATFVFPIQDRLPPQELPMIAGLAVRQTAQELTGKRDILLKWPNDLLHDGKKLAGLLCERVNKADLVGIGLNVNVDPEDAPRDLREKITSLWSIGRKSLSMTDVMISLARNLHAVVRRRAEKPFSVFVQEYEKFDALNGKMVTVLPMGEEPAIVGRCEGVDGGGRLMIRQRAVLHRVVAGQIVFGPGHTEARSG
jgi:BirA family transcriptional regulator, biotin operon repressor / biotin---[acetyl-CoA-carboxylase] ligase